MNKNVENIRLILTQHLMVGADISGTNQNIIAENLNAIDEALKNMESGTIMPEDYDSGIINDYGGGNVQWWQDYIRSEVGRCNDYWREQIHDHL